MKKILLYFGLVSVLTLVLVASNSYATGTMGRTGFTMFDSSNLIGAAVRNSRGEFVGVVNEVTVDSAGNAFANINYYDLYYASGVNTPVPIQELRISRTKGGQDIVFLKTDMEHLDFAPYLKPIQKDWPNRYEFYGIQPYWTWGGTPSKGTFTEADSRDLVGAAVEDSCGKIVGVVNEVMVDTRGHAFAIVNHGDYDLYGDDGVNTPVPFQELTVFKAKGAQETAAVLKTDMEHLDFAPYLDPVKMDSRRYEASIYEYYGIQPYWTQGSGLSK
jgi:sporulation protein YlmC with PRC-barrel domain